jgi:hypothetical protein
MREVVEDMGLEEASLLDTWYRLVQAPGYIYIYDCRSWLQ